MGNVIECTEVITVSPEFFEEHGEIVVFQPQTRITDVNPFEARAGVNTYRFAKCYKNLLPEPFENAIEKLGCFAFVVEVLRLDGTISGDFRTAEKLVYISMGQPLTFERRIEDCWASFPYYDKLASGNIYQQKFACTNASEEFIVADIEGENLVALELVLYRRMV